MGKGPSPVTKTRGDLPLTRGKDASSASRYAVRGSCTTAESEADAGEIGERALVCAQAIRRAAVHIDFGHTRGRGAHVIGFLALRTPMNVKRGSSAPSISCGDLAACPLSYVA